MNFGTGDVGVSHNQKVLPHTDTFGHYAARGMEMFLKERYKVRHYTLMLITHSPITVMLKQNYNNERTY